MTDLDAMVSWLRDQILADRAAAEACSGAPWSADVPGMIHVDARVIAENKHALGHLGYVATFGHEHDRQHAVTHDPRDVIADCDAKLAMLDEYERIAKSFGAYTNQGNAGGFMAAQTMIRLLAQGYRHRDGFREDWAA